MKRGRVYTILIVLLMAVATSADDYVEDVYYWADVATQRQNGTLVPHYSTRVRELTFVEDTVVTQRVDTIRATEQQPLPMDNIQ